MKFGAALEQLKQGARIARAGWNGKAMFLLLVQPPQSASPSQYMYRVEEAYEPPAYKLMPWIGMKTADNCFVPWLASQTDVLAEDWEVLEKTEPTQDSAS